MTHLDCISREEISCLSFSSCLFYLCCQHIIVVLEAGNRGSVIHDFPHTPFRREEHWLAALFGFFWKIHLKVCSFCLKSIQWQALEYWFATFPDAVRIMKLWNKSKESFTCGSPLSPAACSFSFIRATLAAVAALLAPLRPLLLDPSFDSEMDEGEPEKQSK